MCTKMLIPMKYCILCIKRLSPNFASNIKRSFEGINRQLRFPLKIPWFSKDFRKNKSLILILEAKFGFDSQNKHSWQEKSMFKVNKRNTRTNCAICSRFVRTAIEHIRISQLLQDFDVIRVYLQIKYLYISNFVLVLQRLSGQNFMLHHSNTQQKSTY